MYHLCVVPFTIAGEAHEFWLGYVISLGYWALDERLWRYVTIWQRSQFWKHLVNYFPLMSWRGGYLIKASSIKNIQNTNQSCVFWTFHAFPLLSFKVSWGCFHLIIPKNYKESWQIVACEKMCGYLVRLRRPFPCLRTRNAVSNYLTIGRYDIGRVWAHVGNDERM